jgi:hypothetical protein
MAKKLIEGKTRKSKSKKMSHTGGNSRPLKDSVMRENGKWISKVITMEGRNG